MVNIAIRENVITKIDVVEKINDEFNLVKCEKTYCDELKKFQREKLLPRLDKYKNELKQLELIQ